jgi:hypothetical protein
MAAISLIVGVAYYIIILRTGSRNRKAQLYLQFQSRSFDPKFNKLIMEVNNEWQFENQDDFLEKYGFTTNSEAFSKFTAVGSYFDSMGLILQKGLITVDMLPEIMAIAVLAFWEKYKSIATKLGETFRRPGAFDSIEHLYNAILYENKTLPT